MTDQRRHHADDEHIENMIRGLPRREPDPALRAQVLSRARPRTHRPWVAPRPLLAAALVAALLLIDVVVLKVQDRSLPGASQPSLVAATAGRSPTVDADATWLAELLGETAPTHIAWLHSDPPASDDSYATLRESLLANGSGG
jgi:hypothetical protein